MIAVKGVTTMTTDESPSFRNSSKKKGRCPYQRDFPYSLVELQIRYYLKQSHLSSFSAFLSTHNLAFSSAITLYNIIHELILMTFIDITSCATENLQPTQKLSAGPKTFFSGSKSEYVSCWDRIPNF